MDIARHIIEHAAIGITPVNINRRAPLRMAVIGDSTTCNGEGYRWGAAGMFARSNAEGLTAGEGTLTLYSNSTATWSAPGDAAGPVTPVGEGIVYLESDSADMGMAFNITASSIAQYGLPNGNPISVTVEAKTIGYSDGFPFIWGQILSGWKLDLTSCLGMDGDTTGGVLERIAQVFTIDSLGGAITDAPDCVQVLIGVNDVYALANGSPIYTLQDVLDNLTAIRDAIVGNGAYCIFGTLTMETPSAGELGYLLQVNDHIRSLAAENSMTRVADYFYAVRNGDSDTGNAITGYMDGLHYTTLGAVAAGRVLATVINEITGTAVGRSRWRFAGDTSNLVTNGALLGTAGSAGGDNISGNFAVDTLAPNATVVGSKETVAGETPWQVYTISNSADDDLIVSLPAMDLPDVAAVAEVEFTISDASKVKNIDLIAFYTDNDALTESQHAAAEHGSSDSLSTGSLTGVLRTNGTPMPSWAVQAQAQIAIKLAAAASTVIKVRALGAGE